MELRPGGGIFGGGRGRERNCKQEPPENPVGTDGAIWSDHDDFPSIKHLQCVASISGGFRIAIDSPIAPLHNLPLRYLATIWAILGQNQFEKIGFDETISCEPLAQIAG